MGNRTHERKRSNGTGVIILTTWCEKEIPPAVLAKSGEPTCSTCRCKSRVWVTNSLMMKLREIHIKLRLIREEMEEADIPALVDGCIRHAELSIEHAIEILE